MRIKWREGFLTTMRSRGKAAGVMEKKEEDARMKMRLEKCGRENEPSRKMG